MGLIHTAEWHIMSSIEQATIVFCQICTKSNRKILVWIWRYTDVQWSPHASLWHSYYGSIWNKAPVMKIEYLCHTPFTPRSQDGPRFLNTGQSRVWPGFRPVNTAGISRVIGWVYSFTQMHDRDWPMLNPAGCPGWIARSLDPGYFLGPFHQRPDPGQPSNDPCYIGGVKWVLQRHPAEWA